VRGILEGPYHHFAHCFEVICAPRCQPLEHLNATLLLSPVGSAEVEAKLPHAAAALCPRSCNIGSGRFVAHFAGVNLRHQTRQRRENIKTVCARLQIFNLQNHVVVGFVEYLEYLLHILIWQSFAFALDPWLESLQR